MDDAARARNPADFDEVYRTQAAAVARWAARLGGPAIDVEDVVQEVFVIVHRQLDEFRGDAKISTWLFRITANVVRHQRRKLRFRRWLGGSSDEVGGDLPAPGASPLETLEQREASATLYRALDGMAEKYRTVIVLFELEGRSGEEIAELLGARPATVWVWLHRARAQLLAALTRLNAVEAGS